MKNHFILVLALMLFSVVACKDEEAAQVATTGSSTPAASETSETPLTPYLPEGVVFAFKHKLRITRAVTDKQGRLRTRAILDFLEGDAASVSEQAKSAMIAAGYRFIDANPAPHDANRMRFHKPGSGMVIVSVYPAAGEHATQNAIGTIVIDYD